MWPGWCATRCAWGWCRRKKGPRPSGRRLRFFPRRLRYCLMVPVRMRCEAATLLKILKLCNLLQPQPQVERGTERVAEGETNYIGGVAMFRNAYAYQIVDYFRHELFQRKLSFKFTTSKVPNDIRPKGC